MEVQSKEGPDLEMSDAFAKLFEEIKALPITELRFANDSYLECVIHLEKMPQFSPVFENFFGLQINPKTCPDWKEISNFINHYGGVRGNQSLYFLRREGTVYYAMIWPWGDRTSATVRVERVTDKKNA